MKAKLLFLIVIKYLFFTVTYLILWIIVIFDCLVYATTVSLIEPNVSKPYSKFCARVLEMITQKEIDIIFKHFEEKA